METPITINEDQVRRNALNSKSNPRQTIYGEATQTLNPLTGNPYADGMFMPESEIRDIERSLKTENPDMFYLNKHTFFGVLPNKKYFFVPQRTNEAIELQKALGRMEVREGVTHDYMFGMFLDEVEGLVDTYAKNPALTLDSITDVNGLNSALRAVEREKNPKKKYAEKGKLLNNYIIFEEFPLEERLYKKKYPLS